LPPDLDEPIARAVKTGSVVIGLNRVVSAAANGRVRLVIAASNAPEPAIRRLKELCHMEGIQVVSYPKGGLQLGRVCARRHAVMLLGIRSPGESNILDAVKPPPTGRRRASRQ